MFGAVARARLADKIPDAQAVQTMRGYIGPALPLKGKARAGGQQ